MSFPAYPAYRESGVEWIGHVPASWAVLPFKRAAQLSTERATGRSFPVGLEHIESWSGRMIDGEASFEGEGTAFLPGDILFGKLRPYLAKAWLADRIGEAVGDFHVIRPRPPHVPEFLQRVLLSREPISLIDGSTYGAKMPRASWEFIGSLPVPLPPPAEQRTIAAFLDREAGKINALVAEQERLIALLKEKRQAVISHAVTKGLDPDAPMKDSSIAWLGQVPAHWEVRRGRHLFVERDERSATGDEILLTVSHLTGVTPRSEKIVYMFEAETTEGYKRCLPGDLVINTLWAWMGAMGVATVEGIVSPAYHVYTPRASLDPSYVNAVVRMPAFAREASRWSKGVWASRLRLYPEEMFQIEFPVPPLDEQQAIATRLEAVVAEGETLTTEAERAIALLKERRAALISAAVTGKIDVRGLVAPAEAKAA